MPAKYAHNGDDLTIDANVYNAAVDLYQAKLGSVKARGVFRPDTSQGSRIICQNLSTGGDLPRFSVVQFGSAVIDPSTDEDAFLDVYALTLSVAPTSDNYQWGITQEAIPYNDFGEVLVSGVTAVQIDMSNVPTGLSPVRFAAPYGQYGLLQPAKCGMCRVLWVQPGNDQQWALVNLG